MHSVHDTIKTLAMNMAHEEDKQAKFRSNENFNHPTREEIPPVNQNQLNNQIVMKLRPIKDFPIPHHPNSDQQPYKIQKALLHHKIVSCINIQPYIFHELMMTLPDFVQHFYAHTTIERAMQILQDDLKISLYKGNR